MIVKICICMDEASLYSKKNFNTKSAYYTNKGLGDSCHFTLLIIYISPDQRE